MTDRRSFLGSLGAGALGALGLAPACARPAPQTPALQTPASGTRRGLAPADDFLFDPGLTYLQTGSLGPTPRPVIDHTLDVWKQLESDPTVHGYGDLEHGMESVRGKAAALLGCALEQIVMTNCTTEGMNWAAQGVKLAAGDRILTTDQEHPGGRVGWDFVAKRYGAAIDVVAIPPGENDAAAIVERFAKAITPRTVALSFSHVLSSTGLRMPVVELSALARKANALAIVDGAQAAGAIAVDVKALGCHVYATSGHKWLLGPKGTGLLYLSDDLGTRVELIALQDGRAVYTHSSGVCSIPSVHGLGAALDYVTALGIPRIEAHNLELHRYAHERLSTLKKLRIVSPSDGALASPLLTYMLPDSIPSGELSQRIYKSHHVEVKVVPKEWLNGQRVSTHLFNDTRDVDRLVEALAAALA